MGSLDGRVAIVTGGASGIGARTVRLFAEQGARVVIGDMQEEAGRAVAAELGKSGVFQRTEVSREDDVRALVGRAEKEWGRLDCIFNNAGFGGALGPVAETPVEEFDITFAVLVRGVFLGMKHAAPLLVKQGGTIINTASVAGMVAGYSPHAYAAAKAAVIQLTKSVALELAPHNVRVNCICPGFIATPLALNTVGRQATARDLERAQATMTGAQPIQRPGDPDDIAQMALFLASDHSTFVTGQAMVVDGGFVSGRPWSEQPDMFKTYRPFKIYRPS
ncbi:MAG TPA: glucose 1-dehydrogenase [Myxococcota bacterium]|nr:glucose 1-dehydrogenase [Myxococcota bacterium]